MERARAVVGMCASVHVTPPHFLGLSEAAVEMERRLGLQFTRKKIPAVIGQIEQDENQMYSARNHIKNVFFKLLRFSVQQILCESRYS